MKIIDYIRDIDDVLKRLLISINEENNVFYFSDDIKQEVLSGYTCHRYGFNYYGNDVLTFFKTEDEKIKNKTWIQVNSDATFVIINDNQCPYDNFMFKDNKIVFLGLSSDTSYELDNEQEDYFNINLIFDMQKYFTYNEFNEIVCFYKKYKDLIIKYKMNLEISHEV